MVRNVCSRASSSTFLVNFGKRLESTDSVANPSNPSISEKKARRPSSTRGEDSNRSTCWLRPSGESSAPDCAAAISSASGVVSQRKKLNRDARE